MTVLRKLATLVAASALVFTGASAASAITLRGETDPAPADLRLRTTQSSPANGSPVQPGDAVEITLELTNLGPSVATYPQIIIESGGKSVHWTEAYSNANGSSCSTSEDGRAAQCELSELAGQDPATFTVAGTITEDLDAPVTKDSNIYASWSATAYFDEDNVAGNVDPDSRNNDVAGNWVVDTANRTTAGLDLTVSTEPARDATLTLGQAVKFTAELTNNGASTAASAYVDFTAEDGALVWTTPLGDDRCRVVSAVIRCYADDLAPGALPTTFTVQATVTSDVNHLTREGTSLLAKWSANANFKPDAVTGSWNVNTTSGSDADLAVSTMQVSPTAATPLTLGQSVEVTVRLTNNGPATAGVAYVVLKAQNSSIVWTPPSGVGSLCNVVSGNMVCSARNLAAGAWADFTVKGTVAKDASHLVSDGNARYAVWAAQATFDADQPSNVDPNSANNIVAGRWRVTSSTTPTPTPSTTPCSTDANPNHQNRHPVTGVETSLVAVAGSLLAAAGVTGLVSLRGRRNR